MAASKHLHIEIVTSGRERVKAQAPVIVSASRATDVPAFYSDWFFNRLEKGYARWRNPFNGADSYVSFANTRFIVFWSKNPKPLLPFLNKLKERGIGCYIQFTLNDYEAEGIEPNVPALDERIESFKKLVEQLGKGGVIWRFDPLLLTDEISTDKLLERIYYIGEQLHRYTEKLVFSFADIATYPRVKRNLQQCHVNYLEWDATAMNDFAQKLSALNRDKWNLTLATCAEEIALEQYPCKSLVLADGVAANSRLRELMNENFSDMDLILPPLKYCTDNALMIACAALHYLKAEKFVSLDASSMPSMSIED